MANLPDIGVVLIMYSSLFLDCHPLGASEASICFFSKGLQSFSMASPLHALWMKASDTCKIQLIRWVVSVKRNPKFSISSNTGW
jgi:hypothetical protein